MTFADDIRNIVNNKPGVKFTVDICGLSLEKAHRAVDKEFIEYAFAECRYNQSALARELNISRGTVRKLLKDYFGEKYIY